MIDGFGIPKTTFRFATNKVKPPKPPEPKMVEVYYGRCKHKMMVKMWVLGTDGPDPDGQFRAKHVFRYCPDCERLNSEVDAATSIPTRDADSDPRELQTRNTTTGS